MRDELSDTHQMRIVSSFFTMFHLLNTESTSVKFDMKEFTNFFIYKNKREYKNAMRNVCFRPTELLKNCSKI